MTVSVIIVAYNNSNEIASLKDSVIFNRPQNQIETIIVDNNSSDDTVRTVKSLKRKIVFVRNTTNKGFAVACNQAAKLAKGEYLLFLNPDTKILHPKFIRQLVTYLETKKDSGILGCKVLNIDRSIQPSCGNFPTPFNVVVDRLPIINKMFPTHLIRQEKYYLALQKPDWVSGVCMLVPKKIFATLGGFDEDYFLYVEDIDFCYRAKKAGYNIYYTPNAVIQHQDMGKSPSRRDFKATQIRKGLSIFFHKHYPSYDIRLWNMILTAEQVLRRGLR